MRGGMPLLCERNRADAIEERVLRRMAERQRQAAAPVWEPLPHQNPPAGAWDVWLLLGGRGSGKTEAMARYVRAHLADQGASARVGIGAPTIADARDICAEGASGLITLHPGEFEYNRSLGEARHRDGGYVKFLGSEKPDRWNGPQWTLLWWDELALCNRASVEQSLFGLRLGAHPRLVASTTPKGNNFVRGLADEAGTVTTRATMYDNPHLSPIAVARLKAKYEGTRLGRQELNAEWLDDVPGALWQRAMFEERRAAPDLARVVVGVDPAATATEESDETGIVVVGKGVDGQGYVLADRSCRLSPDGWARRVIAAYDEFGADRVIVEVNNGGDMVAHTLRTVRPRLSIQSVHASRGKLTRAEPIAALYEQRRVWHTAPFPDLEDQLCSWTPESGTSPDRLDAVVWALTALDIADERRATLVTW
jgi:phage terminase large subunit-like protein